MFINITTYQINSHTIEVLYAVFGLLSVGLLLDVSDLRIVGL